MEKQIQVKKLNFSHNKKSTILSDLDLLIRDKRVHLLVGSNGAGKSTLLKILSNLINSYSGEIKNAFNKITFVPEKANVPKSKKVKEFLIDLLSISKNCSRKDAKKIFEKQADILKMNDILEKKCGELSSGQLKKIFISLALLSDSDLIIFDEPFANLDKKYSKYLYENIKKMKQTSAIIIASHIFDNIDGLVDDLSILNNGKLVYSKDVSKKSVANLWGLYEKYIK